MIAFNEKGITCSDEPTENYQLTLRFFSALQSFIALFASLFLIGAPQMLSVLS